LAFPQHTESISFINNKNNIGPKTEPWGTKITDFNAETLLIARNADFHSWNDYFRAFIRSNEIIWFYLKVATDYSIIPVEILSPAPTV
jgi:hypothetical protein